MQQKRIFGAPTSRALMLARPDFLLPMVFSEVGREKDLSAPAWNLGYAAQTPVRMSLEALEHCASLSEHGPRLPASPP